MGKGKQYSKSCLTLYKIYKIFVLIFGEQYKRAKEKYPEESPRVISDNGPQFIAKDFKEFIRVSGMDHVRTSPYYPQSNGKIERWHQSLKRECIRVYSPMSLSDARRLVGNFVEYYNTKRLHSALGYITPKDKLEGKEEEIFAERNRKLNEAREHRKAMRKKKRELWLAQDIKKSQSLCPR